MQLEPADVMKIYIAALLNLLLDLSYATDCSAGIFLVSSQQDVTKLDECANAANDFTLDGNVIITPEASGDIQLFLNGWIDGNVTSENNSLLKSLDLSINHASFVRIDGLYKTFLLLRNLTSFEVFSISRMIDLPGSVYLEALPALETVDMHHVGALYNLRLRALPKLQKLNVDPVAFGSRYGDIEIKDVGLQSLDLIFNIGYHVMNLTADGIPNVHSLRYSLRESGQVNIHGNDNLTLTFDCSTCNENTNHLSQQYVEKLQLSGLASLARNRTGIGEVKNLTIGTFIASRNSITTLPLDFDGLSSLYIQDNENLSSVTFHPDFKNYPWKEIVITGNPKLKLTSLTAHSELDPVSGSSAFWVWPAGNVTTMVFDGAFDNAFFQPFIDLAQDRTKRPRVLQKFIVRSTLGPDQFNCSKLNELRRAEAFKGEYSCQNQSVADQSGAGRSRAVGRGIKVMLLALVFLFSAEIMS